jgi:hypothetical protein
MGLAAEPYDVERIDRALYAYSSLGREKALGMMRHSRAADFNPIIVSIPHDNADASFPNLTLSHSRASWNVREGSTRTRRADSWKSAPQSSYDFRTSGRTSNSRQRTKRYDNIEKSIQHMLGRTRRWARRHLVVYELAKGPRRPMRKDHCTGTRSRIRKRLNVRHARLGFQTCGGEHREHCRETPCVGPAGKSWDIYDVDNSADYRKYGVISFTKSEDSKKVEKLEPKAKKLKIGEPPVPVPPKLPPCAWCRKMEPKASMARCKTCTFSVHSGKPLNSWPGVADGSVLRYSTARHGSGLGV